MKRTLGIFLSLAILIGCLGPVHVLAETAVTEGLQYSVEDTSVAITGYTGSATELTIPATIGGKPVTSIGEEAFLGCSNLTSIVLPDGVTDIGDCAFSGCSSLTSITLPDGVTGIGWATFLECSSLTSIKLPNSLTWIGESAFAYCSSLTNITFPNSLTAIGYAAFRDCSSLEHIVLPDSVTNLGREVFSGCGGLSSITLPDGMTNIGEGAFSGCSKLTSITLPNSVTCIEDCVFSGCSKLTSVTLPDSMTNIGEEAFSGCGGLSSITLPNSVTNIGEKAFSGCSKLTEVVFKGSAPLIEERAFYNVTATCYYPDRDSYWMDDDKQDYGGKLTWVVAIPDIPTPKSISLSASKVTAPGEIEICMKLDGDVSAWSYYSINAFFTSEENGKELIANLFDSYWDADEEILKYYPDGEFRGAIQVSDFMDSGTFRLSVIEICDNHNGNTRCFKRTPIQEEDEQLPALLMNVEFAVEATNPDRIPPVLKDLTISPSREGTSDKIEVIINTEDDLSGVESGYAVFTHEETGETLSCNFACLYYDYDTGSFVYYEDGELHGSIQLRNYHKNGTYYLSEVAIYDQGDNLAWYLADPADKEIQEQLPERLKNLNFKVTDGKVLLTELKITAHPKTTYTRMGKTAKTTVVAEGEGLTYQWYIKNAGKTKYSKSSVTSATYSCKMSETSKDRLAYCIVTDAHGNTIKSDTVRLRMAASVSTQPKSVVVAKGANAKVTFTAAGDGLKYEWYFKDAGTSSFKKTSSFTGNTYQVAMSAARHGRQIYCKVTDKYGKTVTTNTVTLSMKATITAQPKTSYTKLGSVAKVTVTAVGDGLTYQWYVKDVGDTSYSKSSHITNTCKMQMSTENASRKAYCVITDKYGNTVKTNTVEMRMAASIATQPKSVTVAKGANAKVTFKAAGDGLKYEWYFKDAGASSFKKTSSFTGSTYQVEMTAARSGRQIYCKITDKYGNTVKTDTVTLNMK